MSAPRNKLQDYVSILSKLPEFNTLTTSELFLLGYTVGKHEGKAPLDEIANQLIRCHSLSEKGLLSNTQKGMVEYLLFEGTYEGVDSILEAFTGLKCSTAKHQVNGEPKRAEKVPHDSLPSTQELAKDLQQAAKRPKVENSSNSDKKLVEILKVEEEKKGVLPPENEVITDSQNERLTMEYLKKLEEEEKQIHESERKRKEEENLEKAQCMICRDRIEPDQYNPLEPCGHLFHLLCFKTYVETQVNSRAFPILCPIPECKADIDTTFIKQVLESDTFEKFDQYSFKNFVEGNSEEYSCCPTPDCPYVFVWVAGVDSNDFSCPKCRHQYCLNCRCPYHKGMTCKEYEITNKHTTDDDKFLKFVKGKKYKQCPKCKFWVEKIQGCNHMVCRCKHQFCYKCGGNYPECNCRKAVRWPLGSIRGRRK